MNWTRFGTIMMKLVGGAAFAAGFLINGATMGIALGSGAAVAVFAAEGPHDAGHVRRTIRGSG